MPRATRVQAVNDRLILAEGEQTGHHHSIKDGPNVAFLSDGVRHYLSIEKRAAKLTHQEHATISIVPGDYEVIHQRGAMPGQEQRSIRVSD